MKSLITGVAGFVGSHLAEKLLSLDHDVVGIDKFLDNYPRRFKESNLSDFLHHRRFLFLNDDLLHLDLRPLLQDVSYIFHLAAQPGVRSSWGEEFAQYSENNIRATQMLLEAAKGLKLTKFVYASSSSVYGDTDDLPMREEGGTRPVSPYGVSKLLACRRFPCVSLPSTGQGSGLICSSTFLCARCAATKRCRYSTTANRPGILLFARILWMAFSRQRFTRVPERFLISAEARKPVYWTPSG
jgi:hypothetical protein